MTTSAEIVPGIAGTWHIARCLAGQELATADRLADKHRRFGCYVPLEDVYKNPGNKPMPVRKAPLFPGYVFIWLWGLGQHIGRVKAVPGVTGFLTNSEGIPVLVSDAIMREIQKIEFENWVMHLPRSFFRRRKHETWTIPRWHSPNYGFRDADPARRVDALHKALGLQVDNSGKITLGSQPLGVDLP